MTDFQPVQERDHLATRTLALFALVGLVLAIIAVVIEAEMLHVRTQSRSIAPVPPAPTGTIEQTLIDYTERGPDLRELQQGELEQMGWVDRKNGIARIPIERAMDLVAGGMLESANEKDAGGL